MRVSLTCHCEILANLQHNMKIAFISLIFVEEEEEELYLPRHRLVEVEAILPLTLQTNLILLAVGQF